MRGSGLLTRPGVIRPFWWRVGFLLWGLAALLLGITVVVPSAGPALGSMMRDAWHDAATRGTAIFRSSQEGTGGPAPDFRLALYEGGAFRLADQRGKVVVVNFWASWCVPCRDEAPRIEAAYERFHPRGVAFVGVDLQDTDGSARSFLRQFGIRYPNGLDEGMGITRAYRVVGLPTTFVIGPEGRIRQRWQGELQDGQLAGFIEASLP